VNRVILTFSLTTLLAKWCVHAGMLLGVEGIIFIWIFFETTN